jgi:hypothetical protein
MYKYILGFLLIFIAGSCRKDHPLPDFELNILSPAEGQNFLINDTVRIRAEILLRAGEMHGYELYAYDTLSLAVWVSKGVHTHDSIINIDTFFINNVSVPTAGRLEIRTYMNHGETQNLSTRNFYLSN